MSSAGPVDLSPPALAGLQWEYGRVDETSYAPRMMLLEDGRIGLYRHPNEHRWERRDGALVFLDRSGAATVVFDQAGRRDGRLYLEGWFLEHRARHYLREVPPLGAMPEAGSIPAERPGLRPRRNLVLVRAGQNSLHRQWTRDIDPADRSWDFCVSSYVDRTVTPDDPDADYHIVQSDVQKWQAVHQLLGPDSPLWRYDFIAFPDDDLAWSWRGVNIAFERMRDFDLLLAQPSLDPAGHVIHGITRTNPDTALRYTNFVEVMTPIFSRAALRLCAPSFALSRSGFGLDHLWPKLLGEPAHRIAILDETSVVHTRAQAQTYDMAGAIEEGQRLTRSFGAAERYDVLGSIGSFA